MAGQVEPGCKSMLQTLSRMKHELTELKMNLVNSWKTKAFNGKNDLVVRNGEDTLHLSDADIHQVDPYSFVVRTCERDPLLMLVKRDLSANAGDSHGELVARRSVKMRPFLHTLTCERFSGRYGGYYFLATNYPDRTVDVRIYRVDTLVEIPCSGFEDYLSLRPLDEVHNERQMLIFGLHKDEMAARPDAGSNKEDVRPYHILTVSKRGKARALYKFAVRQPSLDDLVITACNDYLLFGDLDLEMVCLRRRRSLWKKAIFPRMDLGTVRLMEKQCFIQVTNGDQGETCFLLIGNERGQKLKSIPYRRNQDPIDLLRFANDVILIFESSIAIIDLHKVRREASGSLSGGVIGLDGDRSIISENHSVYFDRFLPIGVTDFGKKVDEVKVIDLVEKRVVNSIHLASTTGHCDRLLSIHSSVIVYKAGNAPMQFLDLLTNRGHASLFSARILEQDRHAERHKKREAELKIEGKKREMLRRHPVNIYNIQRAMELREAFCTAHDPAALLESMVNRGRANAGESPGIASKLTGRWNESSPAELAAFLLATESRFPEKNCHNGRNPHLDRTSAFSRLAISGENATARNGTRDDSPPSVSNENVTFLADERDSGMTPPLPADERQ